MADTGFEHRSVHRKERQLLSSSVRLFNHEAGVFERLPYAAFGSKVARHHFRSFGVHDLRSGCRGTRHFEKRRGVKAKPRGKDQALGKRKPVEAKNKIDRELGAPGVADLANVKAFRE